MTSRRVVVVGAGGHAISLAETLIAAGYDIQAFTSTNPTSQYLLGIPVEAGAPSRALVGDALVVVAVGDNSIRARLWSELAHDFPIEQMPSFVHPSATVSRFATVGPGVVVLQAAIVGSGAELSVGCIVNSGAVVEHECKMGEFASMGPGSLMGGRAVLGDHSAVGIGAVIKHGVSIGHDSVIGAGSYVHSDIPDEVVAYGTPARIVRTRGPGEPYL